MKLALVFAGRPETLSVTELLAVAPNETVSELFDFRRTVKADVDNDIVKSELGTVTVTVVLCVRLELTP